MSHIIVSTQDNGDGTSTVNIVTGKHNRASLTTSHALLGTNELEAALSTLEEGTDSRADALEAQHRGNVRG